MADPSRESIEKVFEHFGLTFRPNAKGPYRGWINQLYQRGEPVTDILAGTAPGMTLGDFKKFVPGLNWSGALFITMAKGHILVINNRGRVVCNPMNVGGSAIIEMVLTTEE